MKRTVPTINCEIVFGQHCIASKWCTSRKSFVSFLLGNETQNRTSIHIFFSFKCTLILAEFKRRCPDTIAMFYEKRIGIIDHSCYALSALHKIIFHHSARNEIREKLFSFNLVVNWSIL